MHYLVSKIRSILKTMSEKYTRKITDKRSRLNAVAVVVSDFVAL